MQSKSTETTSTSFNPMSVPGLSGKAQEAVKAAFDAMSTWRNEAVDSGEKNSQKVIEKMAAAAAALGWPQQIVDLARTQMQSITEMQTKTMEHMMEAWEEQLKLPNPMTTSPSAMLDKLKSFPGLGLPGSPSNGGQMTPVNPLQLWMQFAEQWQRSFANAMTMWTRMGRTH
jgi:hypothetical protein